MKDFAEHQFGKRKISVNICTIDLIINVNPTLQMKRQKREFRISAALISGADMCFEKSHQRKIQWH